MVTSEENQVADEFKEGKSMYELSGNYGLGMAWVENAIRKVMIEREQQDD